MGKKRNAEKISYKILSSARWKIEKPVGEIWGRGQEIQNVWEMKTRWIDI